MRSIFFAFLMTTLAVPAFADFLPQYEALRRAANEQCQIPEKPHPLSEKHYQRFLAQVLLPELKMLNTAFVTGFSTHISRYQPLANCVVVFLGRPNDPSWEKGFSFYNRAKAMNSLPQLMFQGFDDKGDLILVPTPDGGVN